MKFDTRIAIIAYIFLAAGVLTRGYDISTYIAGVAAGIFTVLLMKPKRGGRR